MANVVEDYTPMYVGDTSTPWTVYFTDHSGNAWPCTNQTGFTITFSMIPSIIGAPKITFTGANTGSIVDAANGVGQYQFASSDVATPGTYDIQMTLIPSGKKFDYRALEIRP